MTTPGVIEIAGTIKTADGQSSEFRVTKEYGYQQWGAQDSVLWDRVAVLQAIEDAISEFSVIEMEGA